MRRVAFAFGLILTLAACGASDGSSSGDASSGGGAADLRAGAPGATRDAAARGTALVLGRAQIRKGAMTVRVTDVPEAARTAVRTAEAAGGFLESEKTDPDTTTLTLRVPPESFTKTSDTLGRLGTVTDRTVSTEDVTGDVADVSGRLKAARASVDRVRALMVRATTISEVTSLEEELNEREAALESLQTRLRTLEGQTSYASLSVTFVPPLHAAAAPSTGPDEGFRGGLAAGWRVFRTTVNVLLVVLGALLPFALLLVAVGVPVYLIRKRVTARA